MEDIRLINADALTKSMIRKIEAAYENRGELMGRDIFDCISEAPVVAVKTDYGIFPAAEWIGCSCSNCLEEAVDDERSQFCPHCGARMLNY